jgi:GT2 family glycosyltransferase
VDFRSGVYKVNPVLILTHNNLELTKRCVDSVRNQDIASVVYVVDNGSTDGTARWLKDDNAVWSLHPMNMGVSFGWNDGLGRIFSTDQVYTSYENLTFHHCLVVGNDTVLAPWTYRELLSYDVPFVTGVAVDQMAQISEPPTTRPELTDNPDFSCFLIRRECWEKVGPFDEGMKHYSSDQDFHIRAHRLGIRLCKASVPYYHERSSTIRLASPEERLEIEAQANKDREYLRQKWGVSAGGPDYEALFRPETFGCERNRSAQTAPSPVTRDTSV